MDLWQKATSLIGGQVEDAEGRRIDLTWDDLDVLQGGNSEEVEVVEAGGASTSGTGGGRVGSIGGGGRGCGCTVRNLFGGMDEASTAEEEDEWKVEHVHPERLIKDKDPSYLGFPGFFACHWDTGHIYSFTTTQPLPKSIPSQQRSLCPSPQQSPKAKMQQQAYVGIENMQSTYRLLGRFQHLGEEKTSTGSAIALSRQKMVTAAHFVRLETVNVNTRTRVAWTLTELRVLAAEFVPETKIALFGYKCKVLGDPTCTWGSKNVCPQDGSDIAFLEVQEKLPYFLLPCSPVLQQTLTAFGYPGARNFLRQAIQEFSGDAGGNIWSDYWTIMWDDIRQLTAQHNGNVSLAERAAKDWLLGQFRHALRGIADGAQTVSAGFLESMTEHFIGHTCPSLVGISGGSISPMEYPGYIVGCHAGSLVINQNVATSVDNMKFVTQYMQYVLPDLPDPDSNSKCYERPYFNIAFFIRWLTKHASQIPLNSLWVEKVKNQQEQEE